MEYWVLYLCSIADSVHTLLMVLSIVGLIVSYSLCQYVVLSAIGAVWTFAWLKV